MVLALDRFLSSPWPSLQDRPQPSFYGITEENLRDRADVEASQWTGENLSPVGQR